MLSEVSEDQISLILIGPSAEQGENMSRQPTKVDAFVQNQATQNSITWGECRGEEKMRQYLENWQNSFEPQRDNRVNGYADDRSSASNSAGNINRAVCEESHNQRR